MTSALNSIPVWKRTWGEAYKVAAGWLAAARAADRYRSAAQYALAIGGAHNAQGQGVSGRTSGVPRYGVGTFANHPHLAMVGDEPEVIIPLGDTAAAAKYLPMLLDSLPSASPNVSQAARESAGGGMAVAGASSYVTNINVSVSADSFADERRISQAVRDTLVKQMPASIGDVAREWRRS